MADTGAPHFIPYVEPTDLVRDYPAADEAQADAVAAALDAIPVPAGIGSNAVQALRTIVFSTTSTTFLNVTGMQVTITPSSASSKILLLTNASIGNAANVSRSMMRFTRNNTVLAVGSQSGVQTAAMAGDGICGQGGFGVSLGCHTMSLMLLDSPATTSAVTYRLQVRNNSASAMLVGRSTNVVSTQSAITTMHAIEVAA